MEADPGDLVIGSILPFLATDDLPSNWEIFDGRRLEVDDYEDLWRALSEAPEEVHELWTRIGGEITMSSIKLPDMDEEHARAAMFGEAPHPTVPIVLAIKAHRDGNS